MREGFKLSDESSDKAEQETTVRELELFIQQHEKDAKKSNMVISRKMCEDIVRSCFSNISLKLRNEGYTPSTIESLEYDVEAFTNAYQKQAVGPAKSEVFMEFMKSAIPKISKDVLTKEYKKQKENENRLNEAVKILQEKNKMLDDNLREVEDEHGMKQDALEDLEVRLKKATMQEEALLKRAEDEASKRQDLMDDLENEKEKNIELDHKRKQAEKDLKNRAHDYEKEERDIKIKAARGANLSKDEESRIKEASRQHGRPNRRGGEVNLSDLEVDVKSDQGSTYRNHQETNGEKNPKKKKKKVTDTGKNSNCKCIIF